MNHKWENYFDTESEYWKKIQKIYEENDNYPKVVVKNRNLHHKFPRSFSKKDGTEIDNDKDNLVSLSLADHFLVHYYIWKCCKKGYRHMMALAFQYMRKKLIKYASDETIEALAKDYENIMKDVSKIHSIVAKQVYEKYGPVSSRRTHDEMSASSKKGKETMKKHYTVDELKILNYEKMNNIRGKTYEEIYGKEKAEELKNSRRESNHNRKISDDTKKKISESNKGKKRSEESKRKQSASSKGRKLTDEDKIKKSKAAVGRKWYNNGEIQISIKGPCPEGFVPGMLKRSRDTN